MRHASLGPSLVSCPHDRAFLGTPEARSAGAPGGPRGPDHHRRHDRLVRPVPRPAAVLRLVRRPRPHLVAVDLPGRRRARLHRHLVRPRARRRAQAGGQGSGAGPLPRPVGRLSRPAPAPPAPAPSTSAPPTPAPPTSAPPAPAPPTSVPSPYDHGTTAVLPRSDLPPIGWVGRRIRTYRRVHDASR